MYKSARNINDRVRRIRQFYRFQVNRQVPTALVYYYKPANQNDNRLGAGVADGSKDSSGRDSTEGDGSGSEELVGDGSITLLLITVVDGAGVNEGAPDTEGDGDAGEGEAGKGDRLGNAGDMFPISGLVGPPIFCIRSASNVPAKNVEVRPCCWVVSGSI